MAIYYASCASGLESVLVSEVKELGEARKISDSLAFGGVCFSTTALPETIYKLRSVDNVYAFLGCFQDVPIQKDTAISYMKDLVKKVDWEPSLILLKKWKAFFNEGETSLFNKDSPANIKFRVTCDRKCITMKKHPFTSVDAAAALGDGIYNLFGWTGNMRGYDAWLKRYKPKCAEKPAHNFLLRYRELAVDVIAWIRDTEVLLLIALLYSNEEAKKAANYARALAPTTLASSLELEHDSSVIKTCDGKISVYLPRPSRSDSLLYSHRQYRHALVGTSLKPSVAYALLQLGDIQTGHIILDPMCGCATIPLEAADWLSGRIACLAGDLSSKAVNAARENTEGSQIQGSCDVVQWDATNLALRSNCVDRVLCDMPFGIRCGSSRRREWLCPKVLREIVRVLKQDTGIAVLLSQSKTMRHEIEENQRLFLQVLESLPIEMEGIRLQVHILRRTSVPVPIQSLKIRRKVLIVKQAADSSSRDKAT